MNLVAVYNRQPAIRSSGLLRSAKPDRFLARLAEASGGGGSLARHEGATLRNTSCRGTRERF